MASPNVSEIATTTLESRGKVLADNILQSTALFSRLNEKGNVRPFDGGRVIREEIEYQENGTFTRYSGYETLSIAASDVATSAEYEIKQAAVAVVMSGLEELQNSGREQVINLLESRISNAERTMKNNLSADAYSDGTASGGKQMGGLQLIVSDAGTGTVGGINSSTWSFWLSKIYDFSTEGSTPSSTTIQLAMNTAYLRCVPGGSRESPDLIVGDNTYYQYYWQSLQANQRFTNEKMAAAGFVNLKFMNADVVFDGGLGGDAPSSHMYFLNTNFIFLRPHKRRNMVPLSPNRFATNQDAMVKLIGWAGNMTCSGRRYQCAIVA